MDAHFYEELRGRLVGVLVLVADRLDARAAEYVTDFLDHAEYGLALETMTDALAEAEAPLTPDERQMILSVAHRMELNDGRVERNLSFCPGPS